MGHAQNSWPAGQASAKSPQNLIKDAFAIVWLARNDTVLHGVLICRVLKLNLHISLALDVFDVHTVLAQKHVTLQALADPQLDAGKVEVKSFLEKLFGMVNLSLISVNFNEVLSLARHPQECLHRAFQAAARFAVTAVSMRAPSSPSECKWGYV